METVPNCTLGVTKQTILKISKHYNQPGIVSTRMKLTQKVDHFTVLRASLALVAAHRSSCLKNWLVGRAG